MSASQESSRRVEKLHYWNCSAACAGACALLVLAMLLLMPLIPLVPLLLPPFLPAVRPCRRCRCCPVAGEYLGPLMAVPSNEFPEPLQAAGIRAGGSGCWSMHGFCDGIMTQNSGISFATIPSTLRLSCAWYMYECPCRCCLCCPGYILHPRP